jgi:hypothetical protein
MFLNLDIRIELLLRSLVLYHGRVSLSTFNFLAGYDVGLGGKAEAAPAVMWGWGADAVGFAARTRFVVKLTLRYHRTLACLTDAVLD